jgi:tetratricopeptide (TPR) repeat protein
MVALQRFLSRFFQPLLPLLIVLVGGIAYLNSFAAGFVWDDTHDIVLNRRIHSLASTVEPPWEGGSYRPVVYLSFALNYAWGDVTEAWSYRAVNLAVHLAAALVLYGLVRRTLLLPLYGDRFATSAPWIALAVALLWTVHPLQTECVTYIVHRYESFMGLFYLLTLYCVLRGATSADNARPWYIAAVVACVLGMGSKEVMITAPVLALAYDRIFLAETWKELWQRRRWLYVGLAMTWGLLGFQIYGALAGKVRWAGFGQQHLSPVTYALNQPGVILYYLQLAIWPRYLCVDLGWPDLSRDGMAVAGPGLVIGLMLAGTIWGLLRRSWLGFLGLWFFGILSVTSSMMPVADLAAERRMYLSLAAVIVLVVMGGWQLLEWARQRWQLGPTAVAWCAGLGVGAMVVALVLRTGARNGDYYSEESLWRGVLAQRPLNPRGHVNLAVVLLRKRAVDEAILELNTALAIKPSERNARRLLGIAYEGLGNDDEALANFSAAVVDDPEDPNAHFLLGKQYQERGRLADARPEYETALRLSPKYAEAHHKRGTLLWEMGETGEAKNEFLAAITLSPNYADPYDDLALFFWSTGEQETALRNWRRALSLELPPPSAHNNLGAALALLGRFDEAKPHLQKALALKPKLAKEQTPLASIAQLVRDAKDAVAMHEQLGQRLFEMGRRGEAKAHYQAALKQRPDSAPAHDGLGVVLWVEGKQADAITHWRRALEIDSKLAAAHNHLGAALAIQDKLDEALLHLDEAVRYNDKLADAHHHRAVILARRDRLQEAAEAYRKAVELRPKSADYRSGLAQTLQRLGQNEAARKEYDEAIRIDPTWPGRALLDAWRMAVSPDDRKRNGRHALLIAQRVCEAVKEPGAVDLYVLAAAQAEIGDFDAATHTAQRAGERASRDGLNNLLASIEKRQALYRERKPFRASDLTSIFPAKE